MSSPSRAPETAPETIAAAQRRALAGQAYNSLEMQSLEEYELRLSFRRLIDPGIIHTNPEDTATSSLKTLLAIAENILHDPENPQYLRFQATNDTIKKRVIEPKGALEYAIALGFQPEVEDFQPYYRFNPEKMIDLRVGSAILKEAIELDTEKQERAKREATSHVLDLPSADDRGTSNRSEMTNESVRATPDAFYHDPADQTQYGNAHNESAPAQRKVSSEATPAPGSPGGSNITSMPVQHTARRSPSMEEDAFFPSSIPDDTDSLLDEIDWENSVPEVCPEPQVLIIDLLYATSDSDSEDLTPEFTPDPQSQVDLDLHSADDGSSHIAAMIPDVEDS